MKKKLAILLVFVLMMGMTLQAEAAEAEVGSLYACQITIGPSDEGVYVSCITRSTTKADEIGVKDVVLEKYENGSWNTVMTSSGGSKNNSTTYAGGALYSQGEQGKTYRATCTHYAVYGGTTVELKNSVG